MSWNIWVTAIWKTKEEKHWKPVFKNGDDFTSNGKHVILTEDPFAGEIDIMEELDRSSVNRQDLPKDILDNWGILDKDGKMNNIVDVATIDLRDYIARCNKVIDDYNKSESLIYKALGCSWHEDPDWPNDYDYIPSEDEEKNKLTYPVNKKLLEDLNDNRGRFLKAMQNLMACEMIENLVPHTDDNGQYIADSEREIKLVMIAE